MHLSKHTPNATRSGVKLNIIFTRTAFSISIIFERGILGVGKGHQILGGTPPPYASAIAALTPPAASFVIPGSPGVATWVAASAPQSTSKRMKKQTNKIEPNVGPSVATKPKYVPSPKMSAHLSEFGAALLNHLAQRTTTNFPSHTSNAKKKK